jgi:hypothetical protein
MKSNRVGSVFETMTSKVSYQSIVVSVGGKDTAADSGADNIFDVTRL